MSMNRLLGFATVLVALAAGVSLVIGSSHTGLDAGVEVAGSRAEAHGPNAASENGHGLKIGHSTTTADASATSTTVMVAA